LSKIHSYRLLFLTVLLYTVHYKLRGEENRLNDLILKIQKPRIFRDGPRGTANWCVGE